LASAICKDQCFTLDALGATIIAQGEGAWQLEHLSGYLCRYASGANNKRQGQVGSDLVETSRLSEDVPIRSRMLDFIGTR